MKVLLNATNIHVGGGKRLLCALIDNVPSHINLTLFVDSRFKYEIDSKIKVKRIKASLIDRLKADIEISKISKDFNFVLNFGNLPPLFKYQCKTILFLQNRLLIERFPFNMFGFSRYIKIQIEKWWLKLFIHKVDKVVVQTNSMKKKMGHLSKGSEDIFNFPFLESNILEVKQRNQENFKYDFIYVASLEKYKNHLNLLWALKILKEKQMKLKTALVLSGDITSELNKSLQKFIKLAGLDVTCFYNIPSAELDELYLESRSLIFPSTLESFGLPLFEARHLGLNIVAANLDFVVDSIDVKYRFDPYSPADMANTIEMALSDISSCDLSEQITNPQVFWQKIQQI